MGNVDEMDRFLPRLNHKETENLNGSITKDEIGSVIKVLRKKIPGPDGFRGILPNMQRVHTKTFQKSPYKQQRNRIRQTKMETS